MFNLFFILLNATMSVSAIVKTECARDVNDNHVQTESVKSDDVTDDKCRRVQLVVPEPKRYSPGQPLCTADSRCPIPKEEAGSASPVASPSLPSVHPLPWQLPLYQNYPHYPFIPYPGFSAYPFPVLPEHVRHNPFTAEYLKYIPNMGMFSSQHFSPLSPFQAISKNSDTKHVVEFTENNSFISKLAKEEMKDNRETSSPIMRTPTVFLDKGSVMEDKKKDKEMDTVKYQCETCNKSYSTFSGLSKHKQFHCAQDSQKEFTCKYCEKTYVSLGALKMHIRTHTLPCKCKICGKAFSRPWLLQGHVRTHTGEKPFTCVHCLRAFADRSNLRAHLQTHSDVKKYSCRSCSKTFSRMSLLLKHEDTCRNMTI